MIRCYTTNWATLMILAAASAKGQAEPPRVTRGLLALYTFEQGTGEVIRDQSGVENPLDLEIEKSASVQREAGHLLVRSSTQIISAPAQRIARAVQRSNELTIEAWVTPASHRQTGPARIVSLSHGAKHRNFTLGQDGNRFDFRLRTTSTDKNGTPSIATPRGSLAARLTHVVLTRDRSGKAAIYLNGEAKANTNVRGDFSNWDSSYRLSLANELDAERPWLGGLHLVAIYSRALAASEVARNFDAGADAALVSPELLAERKRLAVERHFETRVAPLLARHCAECHDAVAKAGGLDLTHKATAFAGGDSGKIIAPGKPTKSSLWTLVASDKMPHDRAPLPSEEKQALRDWIERGSPWTIDYIDPVIFRQNQQVGQRWVRRLTVAEYAETVRSAVGVDIADRAREVLPLDVRADGFSNTAYNLTVDLRHVEAYSQLARVVVERMDVATFARRFTTSNKLTDKNMRGLVEQMGKWLLRGPLDGAEVDSYLQIAAIVGRAGKDFELAARLIVEAMLQSPRFIYRIEKQRRTTDSWEVGPYELASRMSYTVWGGPPDKELMQSAESGRLGERHVVAEQVRRMLRDDRAIRRSLQFASEWLNLNRLENLKPDAKKFPNWDPRLATDMRLETLAFFQHVVWDQKRPMSSLFNYPVTFLTPRLAKHYGLADQHRKQHGNLPELSRYDLTQVPSRGGLLTQGSLLTIGGDEASMVTRGLFVFNDLFFSEVGDPPPGLDTTPVSSSPGRSQRAISAARIANQSCGTCHAKFEPLAFGLEKFDGLGAFRERDEHGNQLREDGEIHFPGDVRPMPYASAAEFMDLLAESERVQKGLTRKVLQFALGRPLGAMDAAEVERIHRKAQESGGTYASLITAIVMSDLTRKAHMD